ncbi:hypothetical protein [Nostoc sp.]
MPYTKELLQQTYSLSVEDVDATLTASNLPIRHLRKLSKLCCS